MMSVTFLREEQEVGIYRPFNSVCCRSPSLKYGRWKEMTGNEGAKDRINSRPKFERIERPPGHQRVSISAFRRDSTGWRIGLDCTTDWNSCFNPRIKRV